MASQHTRVLNLLDMSLLLILRNSISALATEHGTQQCRKVISSFGPLWTSSLKNVCLARNSSTSDENERLNVSTRSNSIKSSLKYNNFWKDTSSIFATALLKIGNATSGFIEQWKVVLVSSWKEWNECWCHQRIALLHLIRLRDTKKFTNRFAKMGRKD
jgi:hypothetical protein